MRKCLFHKKLLLMIALLFLAVSLLGPQVYAFGLQESENYDMSEIKNTIEGFFTDYESTFDNASSPVDYSTDIYNDYFTENSSVETEVNIAVIDTMLYRRLVIRQECPGDLRELNKKLSFDYISIRNDANSAEVVVNVTKTFHYASSMDIESATADIYTILLVKENNQWKISKIDNFVDEIMKIQLEDANIDINSIVSLQNYRNGIEANVKEYFIETMLTEELDPITTYAADVTYDGDAASKYALDHALSYNTKYADFSSYGGDCTNFISQCIYEGGNLPMHYGTSYSSTCWYYITSTNRSSSWTGAEEFYNYVFGSTSKIKASVSNWSSVSYGDIIQLTSDGEAYHSMIVTGIQYSSYGRSDLLVSAHSTNRRHVSLATYYSGTKRYIDITGSK